MKMRIPTEHERASHLKDTVCEGRGHRREREEMLRVVGCRRMPVADSCNKTAQKIIEPIYFAFTNRKYIVLNT